MADEEEGAPAVPPPAPPPRRAIEPPPPAPEQVHHAEPGDFEDLEDLPVDRKVGRAMKRLREQARAAKLEADEARQAAELAAAQRAQVARQYVELTMDTAMQQAGSDFSHRSVRQLFKRDYADLKAELGDEAPTFDAWFSAEETRADPVYSRFFQSSAPAPVVDPGTAQPSPSGANGAGAGTPAPPPAPPPNVDAGAGGGASPATAEIDATTIARWGDDFSTWRKKEASARKALEAKYGVALGSNSSD